jgi:hypothetical protein
MKVHIPRYNAPDKIKIEAHDIWSLDYTLAKIIAPSLKLLIQDPNLGCPGHLITSDTEEDFEAAHQQWKDILGKMLWSFEAILSQWDENQAELPLQEDKEGWDKFINQEGERDKRNQEGLDLFGKYYRNLWT